MTEPRRDYYAALDALERRGRFGIRLGLGRTRALLRALGDPHLGLRGALIGGTNGKGSVQAMVGSILREAGHRVGQTPKPHLVSYRERLQMDGTPIDAEAFTELVWEVTAAADGVARRLGPPTEFELLTAAAFTWFRRQRVELAVVEVGLGGRLDATNVWDGGVAAITNVDRDHMDRLGGTIPLIAREKAAIIKRGDRAVTGATGEALAGIRRRARRLGVGLDEVEPLRVTASGRTGIEVAHPALGKLRVGLLGQHQGANAAVAIGVVQALRATGVAIPERAVRTGLERVRWPGRLELLTLDPSGRAIPGTRVRAGTALDVLLDGAHNVAGVEALVAALRVLRRDLSSGRPTLLVALMGDKEVEAIAGVLAPWLAETEARVVTTAVAVDRALPAGGLAALVARAVAGAGGRTAVEAVEPVELALEAAIAHAREADGPLIVGGSLYLVGAVRGRLVDDPLLRDPPRSPTVSAPAARLPSPGDVPPNR